MTNTCYKQPDFYHFSEDSIELARQASHVLQKMNDFKRVHVLDLGAGCGVVGIEFMVQSFLRDDRERIGTLPEVILHSLELQEEFFHYWRENCQRFLHHNIVAEFFHDSFAHFYQIYKTQSSPFRYDFVLGNLPYYHPRRGKVSTKENQAYCRHFIVDGHAEVRRLLLLCCELNPAVKIFLAMNKEDVSAYQDWSKRYFLELVIVKTQRNFSIIAISSRKKSFNGKVD